MSYLLFITIFIFIVAVSIIKETDRYIILGFPLVYIISVFVREPSLQTENLITASVLMVPAFFQSLKNRKMIQSFSLLNLFSGALLILMFFLGYQYSADSLMSAVGHNKTSEFNEVETQLIIVFSLVFIMTLYLENKIKRKG